MRSVSVLLALAAVARAYKYDNTAEAASIVSAASQLSGEGDYIFTNVATGQTLSFVREDITNLYPNNNGDSLAVQFASDGSARLSGSNNKCVSAQWQAIIGRGYDNAAVSYACTVGTGLLTGTDTLEKTKQWWYLVPADGSSSSSDDTTPAAPAASTSDDDDDTATAVVAAAVVKAVKVVAPSSDDDDSTSSSSSAEATSAAVVVPGDRNTWLCPHSGEWVYNRPGYEKIHPECVEDLAAYVATLDSKRMVKRGRASHHDMAAKLRQKRGATQYYIIAQDHILDQVTRAIGSDQISTPGGYTSTVLNEWNKSDKSQLWTITSA